MPKISELTSATSILGTEEIPLVQSTTTKKVTPELLTRKPVFEIDLTSADYNVTQYGIYKITTGSVGLTPNSIMLPNPAELEGMELLFFNYDQTNGADFSGDYQPLLEASTSYSDKYTTIPTKQSVLIVSVNGYWSACSFKL